MDSAGTLAKALACSDSGISHIRIQNIMVLLSDGKDRGRVKGFESPSSKSSFYARFNCFRLSGMLFIALAESSCSPYAAMGILD